MKNSFQATMGFLTSIAIGAAIIGSAFLINQSIAGAVNSFDQHNQNQAIQDCYDAAYYEYTTADGAQVREPIRSFYITCVEDKGYNTQLELE